MAGLLGMMKQKTLGDTNKAMPYAMPKMGMLKKKPFGAMPTSEVKPMPNLMKRLTGK